MGRCHNQPKPDRAINKKDFKAREAPTMSTSANSAPSSAPPLIAFRDVGLTIGEKTIVEHLDMDIRSGEFVCVIGPSGCGKTTTLRLIANLLSPTAGTLTLDGAPIREPRADVAIVFQDYGKALLPWRTVGGNISLALEAMKVAKSERA
jgi:NitT/TauT family transport system ATP-binding protein